MKQRTYTELREAIARATPTSLEADALTEDELQTLRQYGNCLDNILYLSTEKGRALIEESYKRREGAL